jgi:hypothetical protein
MPRGHQKGVPGEGAYGRGVKTEVMRVPAGTQEYVRACLNDLPILLAEYEAKSKRTRNWTEYHRFREQLDAILPLLQAD